VEGFGGGEGEDVFRLGAGPKILKIERINGKKYYRGDRGGKKKGRCQGSRGQFLEGNYGVKDWDWEKKKCKYIDGDP